MKTANQHNKKLFIIIALSLVLTAASTLLFNTYWRELKLPFSEIRITDYGLSATFLVFILIFDLLVLSLESASKTRT